MRLSDKIAIVFGGGQSKGEGIGNGRAICIKFAREGARVMVIAKHLDRAQDTVDMINAEGGRAFAYECDSTIESNVSAAFEKRAEIYGTPDILVHSVGALIPGDTSLLTASHEALDKGFEVNLTSAFNCIRQAHSFFDKEKGGSIVLISSTASIQIHSEPEPIVYNLSKCALNRLGETAAAQFAKDGIRVNNIVLGYLNTPIGMRAVLNGANRDEVIEQRNKKVLLKGGMGDAWDTANAALFLASDEAKFITGTTLHVDGGYSLIRGL